MPRISEFFGIVISMFFDDHPEPHFHAYYAEFEAKITIRKLKIVRGRMPPRQMGKIREWVTLHREELLKNWDLASRLLPLKKIKPLE